MPRRRRSPSVPRKIGNHSSEEIKSGLNLIRNGMSIKKAANTTGVPFTTLKTYYNKTKTCDSLENQRLEPNYSVNKIFTSEQEKSLKDYFSHCALLFYGLTAKECRQIAFQCAEINKLKMPRSWTENQMAGKDWLMAFRKRHDITLRKPEPCSLARATAFNQNNVQKFYDNLENLISRHPSFGDGTRIFNLDETSTTTVQNPQKVIAPKGKKTVSKVTSGERGTLVTTCCIISASGNFLPPVMVFPRKIFKDHMIKNTLPGTLGLAAPTGWMNSSIFPDVIKHYIKHTNSSKENPSILIMDNHESHLCIEALDLAKNSGVHILTLHPHTSGRLQPLDVGIYSPFKAYYNAAIDSWLQRHPGKPVTIYDLGEIIGTAFQKVMTPTNITHSFAKCGIFPFDRNLFTEEDFLPSSVTDRPCPDCLPRAYDTELIPRTSCPDSLMMRTTTMQHIAPAISNASMEPSPSRSTSFQESHVLHTTTTQHTASVAMLDAPMEQITSSSPENPMQRTMTTQHTAPVAMPDALMKPITSSSPENPMLRTMTTQHTAPVAMPDALMKPITSSSPENPMLRTMTTQHTAPVAMPDAPMEPSMSCPEIHMVHTTTSQHITPVSKLCVSSPAKLAKLAFDVFSRSQNSEQQTATSNDKMNLQHPKSRKLSSNKPAEKGIAAQNALKEALELNSAKTQNAVQTADTTSPLKSVQNTFISPFDFRNPIKAGPRQSNRKRRKAGRSLIATDTPEKLQLEQEKIASKKKKEVQKKKINRKVLQSEDEEDEEEEEEIILADSDNDCDEFEDQEDTEEQENMIILTEKYLQKPLTRRPHEGEYVLVKFATKRRISWYIGKVLDERNDDLEYYISFLRYKHKKFVLPDKPDLSLIKEDDIKFICPKPSMEGTSSRPFYKFSIEFRDLNIC